MLIAIGSVALPPPPHSVLLLDFRKTENSAVMDLLVADLSAAPLASRRPSDSVPVVGAKAEAIVSQGIAEQDRSAVAVRSIQTASAWKQWLARCSRTWWTSYRCGTRRSILRTRRSGTTRPCATSVGCTSPTRCSPLLHSSDASASGWPLRVVRYILDEMIAGEVERSSRPPPRHRDGHLSQFGWIPTGGER